MISMLGLMDFFETIIIGDECEHPKPHPEPYLKALEALKVSKDHTFIFEVSHLLIVKFFLFSPLFETWNLEWFALLGFYNRYQSWSCSWYACCWYINEKSWAVVDASKTCPPRKGLQRFEIVDSFGRTSYERRYHYKCMTINISVKYRICFWVNLFVEINLLLIFSFNLGLNTNPITIKILNIGWLID